MRMMTECRIHA